MKLIWRFARETARFKSLYVITILSTLLLTGVNLAAPRVLSGMTGLVEGGLDESELRTVFCLAAALTVLYLSRVLFSFLRNYLAHLAAWRLVADLRKKLYEKMQSLSLGFYHDKQTGDLMSRVLNDTSQFELLYAHALPDTLTNIATVLGVFGILLAINWKLALLTCAPIPLIVIAGGFFSKKVRPLFRASQKLNGDLSAKLQDNLSGISEIQAFTREDYEGEQVAERVDSQIGALLRALRASAVFHPTVEFFSGLGSIIVIGAGGYIAYRGGLSVEDIVSFMLYLSLFYTPVASLSRMLEEISQVFAGAERVAAVLDTPSEVVEKEDALEITDVRGEVEFDRVTFGYNDAVTVLDDISFACKPGQMIALVGPTGVGKSTVTKLLSRSYEPDSGRILVDGHDIRDLTLHSLRKYIAPVMQDTFLFNATIADNIAYAAPGATREQIIAAAKAAYIHDDIMEMPEGYDTVTGERGVKLSGGQKQRIAIARAILRDSPIIVLDEATASVDVSAEREIQKAVSALMGKRTMIVIAHRLSTVREADCIIVLEHGKIIEQGTHAELMAANGYYRRMNDLQSAAAAQLN